jgi:hypothetical protein
MAAETRIPLTMEYVDFQEYIPTFAADGTYRLQVQGELNVEFVESVEMPETNDEKGLGDTTSRVVLQPYQTATYKQSGVYHLWIRCLGYKEDNTFISVWRAQ